MNRRPMRARGNARYEKAALDHAELLDRLVARGLEVPDQDRCLRYLRHIGYFRLSPYLIPFRAHPDRERLAPGTDFDDVLDLYVFDRALRLLVLDAVERVEVAVRAAVTDHMSTTHADPFWYTDSRFFHDQQVHSTFLSVVRKDVESHLSRESEPADGALLHASALEHYLTTYGSPELPPSWIVLETVTIGQLHRLVTNLGSESDVRAIARRLGLTAPLLRSWLRTYVRVRNVCAHHGRLWNVGLGVYPALPRNASVPWVSPSVFAEHPFRARRLYPVLVSLQSVLATIAPASSWGARLQALVHEHPGVPLRGMGFPDGWASDPFWADRPSASASVDAVLIRPRTTAQ